LQVRYPQLENQLWKTQADYSPQIRKGFDKLLNDLHNLGINTRLCMIPLDLLGPVSSSFNQETTQLTLSGSTTYYSIPHGSTFSSQLNQNSQVVGAGQIYSYYNSPTAYTNLNQRRLVIKPWLTVTGNWTIQLQGNNMQISQNNLIQNDLNWRDVPNAKFLVNSSSVLDEDSLVFDVQYRWYRLVITGDSGSIQISAYTVENIFDELICNAALMYILRAFTKEENDSWSIQYKFAQDDYTTALDTVRFLFDANDDGVTSESDTQDRAHPTFLNLVR
jgi:hypothetical protein